MNAQPPWTDHLHLYRLAQLITGGLDEVPVALESVPASDLGLITLALAHGAVGLLHRAIHRNGAGSQTGLSHLIERHAKAADRRNRELLLELHRLRAAMDSAGVGIVPLKGMWLNLRLYGDAGTRIMRDIDLLVPPGSLDATLQGLAQAGYAVEPPLPARELAAKARYAGQFLMHRADRRFAIEPHWAFHPRTLSIGLDHDGIWRRVRTISVGGHAFPTLAGEDEFLALCVHGFKEEWSRLKLIADLARFVRVHPDLDWEAVAVRARAAGAWWIVLVAAVLIKTVTETETGLTKTAYATRQPARIARALLARMTQAAATADLIPIESDIYAVSMLRMRMRERFTDRVRYVCRTLCTPREKHFRAFPLPARLFRVYPVVKLMHDYVLLPCWLLGRHASRMVRLPASVFGQRSRRHSIT